MRFDASQHMRMSQQMKLAPQMIQSMEILQMPLLELQERIEQELENNATLELVEPGQDAGTLDADAPQDPRGAATSTAEEGPLRVGEGSADDDFQRLTSFEETAPDAAENAFDESPAPSRDDWSERSRASGNPDDADAKSEAMANTASRPGTPSDQLAEQWSLTEVEPALRAPGEAIIAHVEDDGYLRTPLATIAGRMPPGPATPHTPHTPHTPPPSPPTAADMERALRAVQLLLEPPGIAARDTRECLLLQIDARLGDSHPSASPAQPAGWELARAIVDQHLDDLSHNRLPRLAEKLKTDLDAIKAAVDLLRTLSLAPGRLLERRSPPAIIPDAFVEYDPERDRYYAYLNDARLPALRINQEYARMAKDRTAPKPTRDFIRVNLSNANFLLDAIEQRKRTVLRVLEAVVDAQRDFFDFGPQALRPLPMTKVAEQLGIHVATVSRAVADKHIATPRGVVPLRRFFSGGTVATAGEQAGQEVSWDAIRAALQEVIDAEDKHNPLSDDQIADKLKERGLEIARRTVAKYRGQLSIPTGRLRKAY
ncbi:MAG: RNA polymerase sigma-54 factor [Planctomyces sp.]|nr:RNA polymerase sigma-54 factor [Planctomyces sp.]MBA4039610.1 RNA polymerase sigma-54 factor [Planctomyces sp.]